MEETVLLEIKSQQPPDDVKESSTGIEQFDIEETENSELNQQYEQIDLVEEVVAFKEDCQNTV